MSTTPEPPLQRQHDARVCGQLPRPQDFLLLKHGQGRVTETPQVTFSFWTRFQYGPHTLPEPCREFSVRFLAPDHGGGGEARPLPPKQGGALQRGGLWGASTLLLPSPHGHTDTARARESEPRP